MAVEALEASNPWVAGLSAEFDALAPSEIAELLVPEPRTGHHSAAVARIASARRAFQHGLVARGQDDWNRWAGALRIVAGGVKSRGAAAECAIAAHVDFSGETFRDALDLAGFEFPGALSLSNAVCERDLHASAISVTGLAMLADLRVGGDLWIDQARFDGAFEASRVAIEGRVEGRASLYRAGCSWARARFAKDSWFSGCRFDSGSDFSGAAFRSDAGFSKAAFGADAAFTRAEFADTLGMEGCRFAAALDFTDAAFRRGTFFNNAVFAVEPVIRGATFVRAPNLDGTQFPEASATGRADQPVLREIAARAG